MHLSADGSRTRAAVAAALFLSLVLAPAAALAQEKTQDKTYVMKLGTATINEGQHEWCKRFAAMVEKDSGGRIKGEIYPASQLGPIPREIEGVQFGEIQGYVGPPEFLVGVDARYEVLSAPGLIADMAQGVRAASDPELQKLMLSFGADKGIHGAALFVAQPSLIIARDPIRHLADLKGKKIRVLAADMQQEMIKRLGGSPVAMTLGDVLPAIQQGTIDGSVLAMTVISTMHYWDAAKYVTETGQPFIFSMAFLSKKWFELAAQGPADHPRCRCRQGGAAGQSVGGRFLQQIAPDLGRARRAHQPACERASRYDEEADGCGRRRRKAQARA